MAADEQYNKMAVSIARIEERQHSLETLLREEIAAAREFQKSIYGKVNWLLRAVAVIATILAVSHPLAAAFLGRLTA